MKTFVKKVFFPLIMFLASTKIAFAPLDQDLVTLTRTQGAVSANLRTILGEVRRLKGENNLILGQLEDAGVIQIGGNGAITTDLNDVGKIIDDFKQKATLAEQVSAQLQGLLTKAQNDAAQATQDARDAFARATALDQQNKQLQADLLAKQDRADQLAQALTEAENNLADNVREEAVQNEGLFEIADVLYPNGIFSQTLQRTPTQ